MPTRKNHYRYQVVEISEWKYNIDVKYFLTAQEVAKYLKVGVATVYAWVHNEDRKNTKRPNIKIFTGYFPRFENKEKEYEIDKII